MTEQGRSVLFVVPRFHTNLAGAVAVLQDAGHKVSVIARQQGQLEDHSRVEPIVLGEDASDADLKTAVMGAAPDVWFLRKSKTFSRRIAPYLRRTNGRGYLYSLLPLTARRPLTRSLRDAVKLRCRQRVTPVPGLDGTPDPTARFLPWPVVGSPPPAMPRPDGPLRILCVGKLTQPRKNQAMLLDVLEGSGLSYSVTFAGSSGVMPTQHDSRQLARLQAAEASCDPQRHVRIQADVPFAQIGALYHEHDVCVLPAFDEPLGMAPLEAMAFGIAPIVSITAGAAGYITHEDDGWHIDPSNPESLAEVLRPLQAHPKKAAAFGERAFAAADRLLSPQAFLRAFNDL